MTLLLGPPSSGKTTLLLTLAGLLHPHMKVNISTLSLLIYVRKFPFKRVLLKIETALTQVNDESKTIATSSKILFRNAVLLCFYEVVYKSRVIFNEQVSGKVTYNGHGMKEFVAQRSAAYISQHDVHIGEMTVRETLAFSARCQGLGPNLG